MGVGGQRHAPAVLPMGKTRYPLYRRLGGPQGRSRRVRKISLSPRFDPRTVQPVASRYTDWATPAPSITFVTLFNHHSFMKLSCGLRNFCSHAQYAYAKLRSNDNYIRQRNTGARVNFSDNRMTVLRLPIKCQYVSTALLCSISKRQSFATYRNIIIPWLSR